MSKEIVDGTKVNIEVNWIPFVLPESGLYILQKEVYGNKYWYNGFFNRWEGLKNNATPLNLNQLKEIRWDISSKHQIGIYDLRPHKPKTITNEVQDN